MLHKFIEDYQANTLSKIEQCFIDRLGTTNIVDIMEHFPMQKKRKIVRHLQKQSIKPQSKKPQSLGVHMLPLNCQKLDEFVAWVCFCVLSVYLFHIF